MTPNFEDLPVEMQEVIMNGYGISLVYLWLATELKFARSIKLAQELIAKYEALWPEQFGEGKEQL